MSKMLFVAVAVLFLSGCAAQKSVYRYDPYYGAAAAPAPNAQVQGAEKPFQAPPDGAKNYLDIGVNPVNSNRPAAPGETIMTLSQDAYAVTESKKKTVSKGWLKAGEKVFVVVASDPRYLEAVGIVRCGNPILNREHDIQPIWIKNPDAPKAQSQPRAAAASRQEGENPCRKRKSGWGSVIGGIVGFVGGLFTHDPGIAAAMSAGGSLIGGYLDGRCIDPQDGAVAAGWGIAGYGLTRPRSSGHDSGSSSSGRPAPLPAD